MEGLGKRDSGLMEGFRGLMCPVAVLAGAGQCHCPGCGPEL